MGSGNGMERAVGLLLEGKRVKDAAREAEVSARRLYDEAHARGLKYVLEPGQLPYQGRWVRASDPRRPMVPIQLDWQAPTTGEDVAEAYEALVTGRAAAIFAERADLDTVSGSDLARIAETIDNALTLVRRLTGEVERLRPLEGRLADAEERARVNAQKAFDYDQIQHAEKARKVQITAKELRAATEQAALVLSAA